MDPFKEVLYDEQSGLTYPVLTGQRKQSVKNTAEFSKSVGSFMKSKGYMYEEKYM